MTGRTTRLLLIGGGHAQIEVLRQFARAPEPGVEIVLVSPESSLLYSGGPPLAANLRRMARGLPLSAYHPQRRALSLLTTGPRHAIASWPPWWAEGDWVWRWKDRIDRRFVARYT